MGGDERRRRKDSHQLLREIHEEVKQLRAATQLYAALMERLLTEDQARRAHPPLRRPEVVPPLKEAS